MRASGASLLTRTRVARKAPAWTDVGAVIGVQVSSDAHIWVLHPARQMEWGPPDALKDPAARLPPADEFDADGNFLQAWGGPAALSRP